MDKLKAWQVIDNVVSQVNATRQQHVELQQALAALKPTENEEVTE